MLEDSVGPAGYWARCLVQRCLHQLDACGRLMGWFRFAHVFGAELFAVWLYGLCGSQLYERPSHIGLLRSARDLLLFITTCLDLYSCIGV